MMDSNRPLMVEDTSIPKENEINPSFSGLQQQFINLQGIPLQILDNTLVYEITNEHLSISTDNNYTLDQLQVIPMIGSSVETLQIDKKRLVSNNLIENLKTDKVASLDEYNPINKVKQKKKTSILIKDFVHICDTVVPQRAFAVLPTSLQFRINAVTPRRLLPPRVLFGPIQGVKKIISLVEKHDLKTEAAVNKMPLYFLNHDNQTIHLDVSDKDKANWMCLLPLGNDSTANVWIFENDGELYGITTDVIPTRSALRVGYSKTYYDEHQFDVTMPVKDLNEEYSAASNREWWCYECCKPMLSENSLQRHIETQHRVRKLIPKKRYRCRNCTKTFSRLFTLKRHLARHCLKKDSTIQDKTNNSEQNLTDSSHNFSQSIEDNRTASDESFQNYTNGLDFSTNLFDDRMAGLDISNSRTESEFNPYSLEDRVDNLLTGHIDFHSSLQTNESHNSLETINENVPVPEKKKFVSCSFCNKEVEKENKRKHSKECRKNYLECECGRIFRNKINLAEHIYTDHSNNIQITNNTRLKGTPTTPNESSYKCEMCEQKFKRRGILVNHLWRVHKISDSKVPLEKRVRHFPCVVCPKVYRSAAKRNQHVRIHHPGAESLPAQCIEGGVRTYEPAQCTFCPRQYATRAKMLQHARLHHPHLMKRRVQAK